MAEGVVGDCMYPPPQMGDSVGKDVNLVSKSVLGVSVFFGFAECVRGVREE